MAALFFFKIGVDPYTPLLLTMLPFLLLLLQPSFVPCYPQPTLSDETAMRIAFREAERAGSRGEVPVGAVVYKSDGSVLSRLETD